MKKIILLSSDNKESDILTLNWEAKFEVTVRVVNSLVEALRLTSSNDYHALIIKIPLQQEQIELIHNFLSSQQHQFYLLIEKPESHYTQMCFEEFNGIRYITDFYDQKVIFKAFQELNIETTESSLHPEFCKIKLYHFLQFNVASVDIYIKIGPDKFIKIINSGEIFTKEIIKKYEDKNIAYLFVKECDVASYLDEIATTMLSFYRAKKSANSLDTELQLATISSINKLLIRTGITEKTVALSEECIKSVISSLKCVPKLWDFLKEKVANESFISTHSLGVAAISSAIASEMDLKTEFTLKKLVMASLLHDIAIKKEHISYIVNENEKLFHLLSDEDKREFKNHPIEAVDFLKMFPELPSNVDTIILEHHEQPNGTGFPRQLDSFSITPLSSILIVAEAFFLALYKEGFTIDGRNKVLDDLGQIYIQGHFKAAFNGLVRLFI